MSMSAILFSVFIGLTAVERLIEVRVSNRNAQWSLDQGGTEYGQSHYPFMVVLHTVFLFACLGEVWFTDAPFIPALGIPALLIAIACQGLRWWCITTLGKRWNTRVIVVPNLPRVTGGPYRFINHPNYVVVALEGLALPLIHSAAITAISFTLLNAALMVVRIRCENEALSTLRSSEAS